MKAEIEYVDSIIGMLMNGLVDREIDNCVNVMIVADHGKIFSDLTPSFQMRHRPSAFLNPVAIPGSNSR